MEDEFDRDYDAAVAGMESLGSTLERLIQMLLEAEGIRAHSVSSRVKKKYSVTRKLQRSNPERSIDTLTDILGIRIITYFRDEVELVAKVVEREFSIDAGNSVDKRAALAPDRFGYLSLHYVCQIGNARIRLTEYRAYKDVRFEIQIRSILQHAWAEIEHDLGYKSEATVPRMIRRRFSRLAGLLELADDEFLGIRAELAAHQISADAEIGKGNLRVDIDLATLTSFVDSDSHVEELDRFIATQLGRSYSSGYFSRGFMERQLTAIVKVGFNQINELSEFINVHTRLIEVFCVNWLVAGSRQKTDQRKVDRGEASPAKPLIQKSQSVSKGISLFYIGLLCDAKKYTDGKIESDDLMVSTNPERHKKAWQKTVSELGQEASTLSLP
jgi:ppGpp synthetase/RelA/SpoT-type nucleotidyltranferase